MKEIKENQNGIVISEPDKDSKRTEFEARMILRRMMKEQIPVGIAS